MMHDLDILERRCQAMRDLPWPVPALTIMKMTDEDLDRLDAAADAQHYWIVLNDVLRKNERKAA